MNLRTTIAQNIRKFRKKRKFSQEELAERANLSTSYIGFLERQDKSASIETIEKIALALNVTPHSLLVPEEERKSKDEKAVCIEEIVTLLKNQPLDAVDRTAKILRLIHTN